MFVRASAPAVKIELAELVDVEDVEVVQTGLKYPLASGPRTFTKDDLKDIVSSQDDAAVKTPRLKLGHVANMGLMEDGQPAIGTLENLKLTQDGHQITGTYKNIPAWLARVLPAAYPARSIEALTGVTTSTGNNWAVVLTDLALLGVVWPGVNTLEDIQALYSVDGPDDLQILSTKGEVEAVFGEKLAASGAVTAQVDVDKISRAYREQKDPDQMWWWIRSMMIEPNELIVEDEEKGQLYRIPYSVKGEDVTFSDPVAVRMKYEDKPQTKQKEAASMALCAAMESMGARSLATYTNKKEFDMAGVQSELDPVALRNALGLAEEATDDDVTVALASAGFVAKPGAEVTDPARAAAAEQAGTSVEQGPLEPNVTSPAGPNDPAVAQPTVVPTPVAAATGGDVVQLDRATYDQLMTGAQAGLAAHTRMVTEDRDAIISGAIREGRIAPSRRQHWETKWAADQEEVRTLLTASIDKGGLAAGLVPVGPGAGSQLDANASTEDQSAYPAEWLPEIKREEVKH
jgi:hypothetical protein